MRSRLIITLTLLTLAVVGGAACSKSQTVDAGGGGGGGGHEAVDRCVEAMTSASGSRRPRSSDAQTATACAPMFKESACREAHLHVQDHPDASSFILLSVACRDAYCPKLRAPKPAICQTVGGSDDHAVGVMMPDFYEAIVEHDYDSVQATRIASAMDAASAK